MRGIGGMADWILKHQEPEWGRRVMVPAELGSSFSDKQSSMMVLYLAHRRVSSHQYNFGAVPFRPGKKERFISFPS
jgi:hypothetical protein